MVLNENQADVLAEVMNLGMGHAGNSLNELVGAHIELRVPSVALVSAAEAQARIEQLGWEPLSSVQLEFSGSLNGNVALMFPGDSAVQLVSLLTGDDGAHDDVDGLRRATLEEAGNILLNGVVGAVSNLLANQISFSAPYYSESDRVVERLTARSGNAWILLSRAQFKVADCPIEGEILLYFEILSLEVLLDALNRQYALSSAG
ncbi:MAG: chemotaxis protein CheC [Bryobacteraceae bacterium]